MELNYDPRTKQQIKSMLYEKLYAPVRSRFAKRLEVIIQQNSTFINSTFLCFNYRGVLYRAPTADKLPRKMHRLAPHLQPVMNAYLDELKQLNDAEIPYVLGYITTVLNASNGLQDYLLLLPSHIHGPIQELVTQCGCRVAQLSAEKVQAIQTKNQASIDLLKQRLVLNLIE